MTTTSGILMALSRDTTDDQMFPTTGSRHRADVNLTGTIFGGDNAYGKYNYGASWFFKVPPFGEDLVFSPRWRIGYIQAFEGKEIPVYELYILGGINSIRGLKDVGPRDPVTGDRHRRQQDAALQLRVRLPHHQERRHEGGRFLRHGQCLERRRTTSGT